jgi:hypothetical protein
MFAPRFLSSCTLLLFAALSANGEEKTHSKAADELLNLLAFDPRLEKSLDNFLDGYVKGYPNLLTHREALKRTCVRVFKLKEVRADVTQMLVKEFSEKELQELAAFYKTPLGQKSVRTLPKISEISQKALDSKAVSKEEFMKVLQEELEKDE